MQSFHRFYINSDLQENFSFLKNQTEEIKVMSQTPSGIIEIASTPMGPERIIPPSLRPDGTVRKAQRIRPGFTPLEDVKRYSDKFGPSKPAGVVGMVSSSSKPAGGAVPGASIEQIIAGVESGKGKSKNQRRNEAKRVKKLMQAVNSDLGIPIPSPHIDLKETDEGKGSTIGDSIDPEAAIKKIKKKLRQINDLEQKIANGQVLDDSAMEKIEKKQDLESELESLISKLKV